MTGLDLDEERRTSARRQDDGGNGTPFKSLGTIVVAISLVGSIFAAGYSWRSVAIVESNQENFVRKDVQSEQMKSLEKRLDSMGYQLDQIQTAQRKAGK